MERFKIEIETVLAGKPSVDTVEINCHCETEATTVASEYRSKDNNVTVRRLND